MAPSAGSLLIDITTNVARLQADMGKVSSIVNRTFSGVKNTIMGAISVGAITALGRAALQMGDDLAKASEKMGIGAEKLSAMRYAAELSDVSFEALQKGMKAFSKAITDAQSSGSDAAIAFEAMGIATKDTEGRLKPLDVLFGEVANKFARFEDGAGKVSLAVALFGRAGMDMIPVLNKGAAGIAEMEAEAKRLGATISGENAKRLEEMNDKIKAIGIAAKSTAANIAADLVGAIESLWRKVEQHGPALEEFFARVFGGDVAAVRAKNAPKATGAASAGSVAAKVAAPNVDAIKKAAETAKKLDADYTSHAMKLLAERAEALADFYGDEAKLAEMAADEQIKAFEERQKILKKGEEDYTKFLMDENAKRSQFVGESLLAEEGVGMAPVEPYSVEQAFAAAEAYNNVALAIQQIGLGYGDLLVKQDEFATKVGAMETLWVDSNRSISTSLTQVGMSLYEGVGSALANVITGVQSASEAFAGLAKMAIAMVVEYLAKWMMSRVIMAIMGKAFQAAEVAAAVVTGSLVAAAWAPAAAFVSLATLGGAAAPAAAALGGTTALAYALALPKAHGGLNYVPQEQTYLLDKGERVLAPSQNEDLTEFLDAGGPAAVGDVYLDGVKLGKWIKGQARQGRLGLALA